jgi:hypothetical protein
VTTGERDGKVEGERVTDSDPEAVTEEDEVPIAVVDMVASKETVS